MKLKIFGGIMVLVAACLFGGTSYAAERFNTVGIGASPAKSERISLVPGGEYSGTFQALQAGNEANEVKVFVTPVSEQDGSRNYEVETDRTRITEWMTIETPNCPILRTEDETIVLEMQADSQCTVNYSIKVPEDAVGGSQHAAIILASTPYSELNKQAEGVGINVKHRYAYTVYADVDGPGAIYAGKIIENNVPWLFLSQPISVSSLISNSGNLDFQADYHVLIKNWFGGEEMMLNDFEKVVLADTESADTQTWDGTPEIGIFEVTQNITLGNEESNVKRLVLVIPIWWLIIIICVLLLLIWALVMKIRQHLKKKSRLKSDKEEV